MDDREKSDPEEEEVVSFIYLHVYYNPNKVTTVEPRYFEPG